MATQVQTRRGTTAQHSTFTGAAGELTVDTDKKTVVVHDGTTAGGAPLLRESGSQNAVTTGTSTAASFIPSSSTAPTNGVYLPAANTVGISTGGSGRLFINNSGQVGLNTNSPARTLHVANSSGDGAIAVDGGSAAAAYIDFRIAGSNKQYIGSANVLGAGGTSNDMTVWNSANGYINFGTNFTERVRITSAGLVGVGTSSPIAPLQIVTTSTAYTTSMLAIGEQSNTTGKQLYFGMHTTDAKGYIQSAHWGTAYKELLLNPNGGNVGIGTSSPATLLDLSSTTAAKLNLTHPGFGIATLASDSTGALLFQADEANTQANSLMQFKVDGTERMRLDSSGRLGIGTTPTSIFHVKAATNRNFKIDSAGGGGGDLRISALNDADSANVNLQLQGDQLFFAAGGAERARIDSSGRWLLGTTASTGATANTAPVIAGAFYLVQGSVTAANATATEIFVIPSGNATYIATAVIPNASDTTNYHATYLVGSNGSSNHLLTALDPGALLTMSLSGSSLRVTQSAGGASEVRWSVTRLATFP